MERESKLLTEEDKLISYYASYGLVYEDGLILCGACDNELYDEEEDLFAPDASEIICSCQTPGDWENFGLDPDEDDEAWDISDYND